MITYETIILASWAIFLLVWMVSAFNVKPDIRGGYGGVWQQYWLLRLAIAAFLVFVATRVARGTLHYPDAGSIFAHGIFPQYPFTNWIGAALSVIGAGT